MSTYDPYPMGTCRPSLSGRRLKETSMNLRQEGRQEKGEREKTLEVGGTGDVKVKVEELRLSDRRHTQR